MQNILVAKFQQTIKLNWKMSWLYVPMVRWEVTPIWKKKMETALVTSYFATHDIA